MSPSRTLRMFAVASAILSAGLAALSGGCPADSSTNPTLPPTAVAGDSAVNDGGGDATGGGLTGGSGGGGSATPSTSGGGGSGSGGGEADAINASQIVVAGWMNEPVQAVLVDAADRTAEMTFELAGEPSPSGAADLFANPGADVTLVYTPVDDFVGDAAVTVSIRDGAASGTVIVRFRVLPKVEFALDRYEGEAPAGMLASATIPSGHTLPEDVQLHWSFGDGSEATDPGTNMNRTHVFNNPGVYLVSLALLVGGVGGELGCTHASPGPAQFTARERSGGPGTNQPPIAAAGADQNVIDEDGNGFALVTLSGGASSDPDGEIVAYTWTVEGGATYGPHPTPSTAISLGIGTWTITLTVMDNGGATASDTLRVVVGSSAILAISPDTPLSASGVIGGPFSPGSQEYTITNSGDAPLNWSAAHGQGWISLSSAGGTLAAGASTTVTVSINSLANSFLAGSYGDTITFSNTASGAVLTRPVELSVVPAGGLLVSAGSLTSAGLVGGPFSPTSRNYTLTNTGGSAITWTATKTRPWVTLSAAGGTLAAGGSAVVTVSLNSQANSLPAAVHSDTVSFANTTNGLGNTTRAVTLTVTAPAALSVTGTDLAASGPPGGPFSPASTTYTLSNSGGVSLNWTAGGTQAWLTVSPTGGTLAAGGSTTVTVSINSSANALAAGNYGATVSFTNATNGAGNATRNATVNVTNVQMASSITQYGITWTFDRPYQVGQFVNGDWWVVGPVTVVSISNPLGAGRDGSMYNPAGGFPHGYDSRSPGYSPQLDISESLPYLLNSGSLVSVLSWDAPASHFTADFVGGWFELYSKTVSSADTNVIVSADGWSGVSVGQYICWDATGVAELRRVSAISGGNLTVDTPLTPAANRWVRGGSTLRSPVKTAAVLTCVASPPAADAFRPAYCGSTNNLYRLSQIRWDRLPSLARVAGTPAIATYEGYTDGVWLDHGTSWDFAEYCRPSDHLPWYPQYSTQQYGDATLLMCMDFPIVEKEPLLINLIQIGIDYYGAAAAGAYYPAGGGHGSGRLWPILFSGYILDVDLLRNVRHNQHTFSSWRFGEIEQTFVVTQADIDRGVGYTTNELGLPEWGIRHFQEPALDSPTWDLPYRRCCTAICWGSQVLASRILGVQDLWSHPVLFDYQDRYVGTEISNWSFGSTFSRDTWFTYRPQY